MAKPQEDTTLQLFLESVGSLVFTVDDLINGTSDDRAVPSAQRAEAYLTARLATGAAYYRDLIADAATTGISKDALYRARRRMGLAAKEGFWTLPDAAVGSQQ